MNVDISIWKPLLLKIELHAAVRIFTTEKQTLLSYYPDSEKKQIQCVLVYKATTSYWYLWGLDVRLEPIIKCHSEVIQMGTCLVLHPVCWNLYTWLSFSVSALINQVKLLLWPN